MRSPLLLAACLALALPGRPAAQPLECSATTSGGETMSASVTSPQPDTIVTGYAPCPLTVEVTGSASVGLRLYDFYFVIDSSGSTATCTGSDIDGDGTTGQTDCQPFLGCTCTDQDDTVLGAEVAAIRAFVATLSPDTSRVAIIQFSMPEDEGFGSRQRIVQSLTSDLLLVDLALDQVAAFGSAGATDYAGGLQLLLEEAAANGDPLDRQQRSYFLSDGVPTYPQFPFGSEEPGDSRAAIDAADQAAAAGIVVSTFGVGFIPSTTQDPVGPPRCEKMLPNGTVVLVSTLECIALRTGGEFFESDDPAAIVGQIQEALPTQVASVVVFNDTTGDSVAATLGADGAWTAEVPVRHGVRNELRVVTTAEDGTSCQVFTDFTSICHDGACDPRTQGFWHRQCLGMDLLSSRLRREGSAHGLGGLLRGGLPSRGGPNRHPEVNEDMLRRVFAEIVDPQVAALGSPADTTACEGLDAIPQSDPCQRAIKQYTALLLNVANGRLAPDCELDLSRVGDDLPTDPAAAVALVAELIRAGLAGDPMACQAASDIADYINTGAALR